MEECGIVSLDLDFNCADPLQAGTNDIMVVINKDDWDNATITKNGDNPLIVEGIDFESGVRGFQYKGRNNSHRPTSEAVPGTYFTPYDHKVNFKVFDLSPEAKAELEELMKGRVVIVIHNRYKGTDGNAAFEIYGADSGMIGTGLKRDPNEAETGGAYDVNVGSDQTSKEPHLPLTLFKDDYLTSKEIFDGLYA